MKGKRIGNTFMFSLLTIIFYTLCPNQRVEVSLSPLEVKELDAIGKHEEEEEDPTHMSKDYRYKEVMIKTQIFLDEFIHWHWTASSYFKISCNVTHLRCKNAIDCPSNWGSPVVPSPPYWD